MTAKQRKRLIMITVASLVTVPSAISYTAYAIQNQPEPEKVNRINVAPRVTVIPVVSGDYHSQIEAFGEVSAVDEIDLSSETSGRVIWINPKFTVGGWIKEGEEIIHIEATQYRTQLANAEKNLSEAALTLKQEQQQKRQALQDWRRSGIKEKPSPLALRDPQLKVANSKYTAAKAAVEEAKHNLVKTRLTTPFDSVVLERRVALGSYVSQAAPVAKLQSTHQAEVKLALTAEQWQLLPTNPIDKPVTLIDSRQPNVNWQGKVQRLDNNIDSITRLRNLIVTVDQPLDQPQPLLFGSFVKASFNGSKVSKLFALPNTALSADGYLWYATDNRLQRSKPHVVFSHSNKLFVSQGELPHKINLVHKPLSTYLTGMKVQAVSPATIAGGTCE